ncbi:hypothetical protein BDA96_03G325700 [Sorghum bicolor]|jgi:hypothetical protein|uniref:Uncharacterized protein n=1 Tax=Sorghum bicolor TaxID=4558 RepID=A0A921UP82_SORBI|nr:hypothetical protein BDA96_03G325700 [Sorghum bicolor]
MEGKDPVSIQTGVLKKAMMLLTARAEDDGLDNEKAAVATWPRSHFRVWLAQRFSPPFWEVSSQWAWAWGMGDRAPGRRVGFYRPSMPAPTKDPRGHY